jgi:hypothetical protein
MGPTICPETSVWNYHYSLRNNPEERNSHPLRGRSLKSPIVQSIEKLLYDTTRESEDIVDSWPLEMGQIGCPETSVRNSTNTRCVITQNSAVLFLIEVAWYIRRNFAVTANYKGREDTHNSQPFVATLGLGCGIDVQGIELNYPARTEIFMLSASSRRALGAHAVQLSIPWKLKFACAIISPFAACTSSPTKWSSHAAQRMLPDHYTRIFIRPSWKYIKMRSFPSKMW